MFCCDLAIVTFNSLGAKTRLWSSLHSAACGKGSFFDLNKIYKYKRHLFVPGAFSYMTRKIKKKKKSEMS